MNFALTEIDQLLQIPAPCPGPLGLACDGPNLWVGCGETNRIIGLDANQGAVFEEAATPAKPYGMCVTGDALRVIIAAPETDDRTIRRYIFGKDFKSDVLRCPDDTGSFLAYDGDSFFVSQRFDQKIVEIDETGAVKHVGVLKSSGSVQIDLPCQRAIYDWWIEPTHDKKGRPMADVILFTINFR